MPSNNLVKYGGIYNDYNTNNAFMQGNKNTTVLITLEFDNDSMTFPVNPEALSLDYDSSSQSLDVMGIGNVSIPTTPKPMTMQISSFFWHNAPDMDSYTDRTYPYRFIEKILVWQESKKPAKIIVQGLQSVFALQSMNVICDKFIHEVRAGEEDCVYFELSLRQYRAYGAKKVDVDTDNLAATIYAETPTRIDNREAHTEVIASDVANTSNPTTVGQTEGQDPVKVATDNLGSIDTEEGEFVEDATITMPKPETTTATATGTTTATTTTPTTQVDASVEGAVLQDAIKENTLVDPAQWDAITYRIMLENMRSGGGGRSW